jgi:uncharacterized protein
MISPYPPNPVRHPVMLQSWEWLSFLHWPYEAAQIRALLPPQLQLDTFDGAAWVGLAPFLLTHLRPPLLPALPWLGQFPETNVRTYVRAPDGQRGVWFFTLEADRLAAVLGARSIYRLPYRWARMSVERQDDRVVYNSRRHGVFGAGSSRIAVEPGDPLVPGEFDHFLTARFRLFATAGDRLLIAEIEHQPWPLQSAELLELKEDLIENSGVPRPVGTPVLHFSRRVDVRIGRIKFASTKPDSESGS